MSLFLVGSGPGVLLDAVHDDFVAEARRFGTTVAIALLGDESEVADFVHDYSAPILARWPEVTIELIHLDDEGETAWPEAFDQLAGLVVGGGWTPGYLEALTPRRDAISRLVRGGVPYLGFSAGAMVASRHTIVGGYKHHGRTVAPELVSEGLEEVTLRDGLALIGPTVETHTDAWSNLGVALAALEESDVRTAVTIDENTCLVVDPASGRTRIVGAGRVHWLQQEGAHVLVSHEVAPAPPAEPEAEASAPVSSAPSSAGASENHVKPSEMPKHVPPHPPEPEQAPEAPDAEAPDASGA